MKYWETKKLVKPLEIIMKPIYFFSGLHFLRPQQQCASENERRSKPVERNGLKELERKKWKKDV